MNIRINNKYVVALATLLATALPLSAQTYIIDSNTSVATSSTLTSGPVEYKVNDTYTLTFDQAPGQAFSVGAGGYLIIGPSTANGDGQTVFNNMGGLVGRQGGAFAVTAATGSASLTNVAFTNNQGFNRGGAVSMTAGAITITNAFFSDNHANGGGAVDANVAGVNLTIRNALFVSNTSRTGGGIVMANGVTASIEDAIFTNNTAADERGGTYIGTGGAIYINQKNNDITLKYTGSYGTTNYLMSGNAAVNSAGEALASAGGFLFTNTNITRDVKFDVADGVTVTIGKADAGTNRNLDTIAGGLAAYKIIKSGSGTIVLNADNSYYVGSTTISAGRIILGNEEAKFGGSAITIGADAVLGGAGIISGTTITGANRSIIQVGADNASAAQTLTMTGALTLANNSQILFDLYNNNQADLLDVNSLTWNTGANKYINISALATGTFTLVKANTMTLNSALTLWVNGAAPVADRYIGALDTSSGTSVILTGTLYSLSGTWAGANGATWSAGGTGWNNGTADKSFQNGDTVTFANTGSIAVSAGGVTASQMSVDLASGTLAFFGVGGITTDSASAQADSPAVAGANGKLVKTGAGALSFANTGTNRFTSGVDINGGAIEIGSVAQLDATGTTLRFAGSGTLAARAGTSGTLLAAGIELADASTKGALDVRAAADAITFAGELRGDSGIFAKTGSGSLVLAGNSSSFTGTTQVAAGRLLLASGANLGGTTVLGAGAIFGGAGTAGKLTTTANSTILVGTPGAAASSRLTLGTLDLAANTTFSFDLISGNETPALSTHTSLTANTLTFIGGATGADMVIRLNDFITGFYDIASFTTYNTAELAGFENASILFAGRTLSGREYAEITANSGTLTLALGKNNETITWTGEIDSLWSTGTNWTKSGSAMEFADGDTVLFNSTDAAGRRDITIGGDYVRASGMEVSGNGNYSFTGGAIMIDKDLASGNLDGLATGKLSKSGAGTLIFLNTGTNRFLGGVDISGGAIEIGNTSQLDATGTSIRFIGTGTLAARAGATGTLAGAIELAGPAANGTLEVRGAGDTITIADALRGTSGIFTKTGSGALTFTGYSATFTGTTRLAEGRMNLVAGANLGGTTVLGENTVFAGEGTVGKLTTAASSTIQVGTRGAAIPGTLAISTLELAANTTLSFEIISGNTDPSLSVNSSIVADTLVFAPGATGADIPVSLNLSTLINGKYNIASFGTYDPAAYAEFENANITLAGRERSTREYAAIDASSDGTLTLSLGKDANGVLTWTGSTNDRWVTYENWTMNGTPISFAVGDSVIFDDTAIGSRVIELRGTYVEASGIEVTGTGNYRFNASPLIVDKAFATDNLDGIATGMLIMRSTGTLTLANTGTNEFRQGVLLENGTLLLARAGVLGTSRIEVTGTDIQMRMNVTGTDFNFQNQIDIADGASLTLYTGTNSPLLSGTIQATGATGSGAFVKNGEGTLTLLASSAIDTGFLTVKQGTLVVNEGASVTARTTFDLPQGTTLKAFGNSTITTPNFIHGGAIAIGKAASATPETEPYGSLRIDGNYTARDSSTLLLHLGESGGSIISDQLIIGGNLSGILNVMIDYTKPMPANLNWDWEPIVVEGLITPGSIIKSNPIEVAGSAIDYILIIDGSTGKITWQEKIIPLGGIDVSALLIGRVSFDSIHRQLAALRDNRVAHRFDVWADALYRNEDVSSGLYEGANMQTQGLQAGAGWNFCTDKKAFSIGLYTDYATGELKQSGYEATTHVDSEGLGAYATAALGYWYADISLRTSSEDYRVSVPGKRDFKTDGKTLAGSISTGYSFKESWRKSDTDWFWEPQLQLTWQRHTVDDTVNALGRVYTFDDITSLQGRAGIRFWRDFTWGNDRLTTLYLRASYIEEFQGESTTTIAGTEFCNDLGGRGWTADAGVRVRVTGHIILNLEGAWLGDNPTNGYGINASMTVAW